MVRFENKINDKLLSSIARGLYNLMSGYEKGVWDIVTVEFINKNLLDLYQNGESKKYPLQQDILTKYFMRIQQLEIAESIYDFWKIPKLNKKWRLEFYIDFENEEKTIGTILIKELSKHYE